MKKTLNLVDQLIEETLSEQQWNKDSDTPRDYSKEYNAPGSIEQEERNKRKRDKRKHDKEFGKCPDNQDLHHIDGVEGNKVKCEPPYINRGRKEKSRLKKGEIVIKIREQELRKIIQEETQEVLNEIFPALAGMAVKVGGMAAKGLATAGKAAVKGGAKLAKSAAKAGGEAIKKGVSKVTKSMQKKAMKSLEKSAKKKPSQNLQKMAKKLGGAGGTDVGSFEDLGGMINQVIGQASDEKLKGDPNKLINQLRQSLPFFKQLKGGGGAASAEPEETETAIVGGKLVSRVGPDQSPRADLTSNQPPPGSGISPEQWKRYSATKSKIDKATATAARTGKIAESSVNEIFDSIIESAE